MPASNVFSLPIHLSLVITFIFSVLESGGCCTIRRRYTLSTTLPIQVNYAENIQRHTTTLNFWRPKSLRGGCVQGSRNDERRMEQTKPQRSSIIEPDNNFKHRRSGIELFPVSESKQNGLKGSCPNVYFSRLSSLAAEMLLPAAFRHAFRSPIQSNTTSSPSSAPCETSSFSIRSFPKY
jgi:hypothetical protein